MKYFIIIFSFITLSLYSENPLTPQRLGSPSETLKVFLDSMNGYSAHLKNKDEKAEAELEKALKCLDTKEFPAIIRIEKGKQSAVFLKEVLDRIYAPDWKQIPSESSSSVILKWVVPETEITLLRVSSGDREGEFLFSPDTVQRAEEFYKKTKHMPYLTGTGNGAGYSTPWEDRLFPAWSQKKYFSLQLWQWIGIPVSFLLGLMIRYFSRMFFYILLRIARKTPGEWDERVILASVEPGGYLLAAGFWFILLYMSGIEGRAFTVLSFILKAVFGYAFIFLVSRLCDVVNLFLKARAEQTKSILDEQLVPLLSKSIKLTAVTVSILLCVQNMGINVLSILAGLGIGGLAIALAAKDTAANLFGSVMIFLDKPFLVGDHVIIGSSEGVVEEIGFRSTRLRTWDDSIVSIPNSTVASANINNMGMRRCRRTNVTLNVTYDTSSLKMEAFLEGIKNILRKRAVIQQDKLIVGFSTMNSSSLDIIMHFYADTKDWAEDIELRQNIYIEIMHLAEEIGVTFAYPSQSLYVETFPEKEKTVKSHPKSEEELTETAANFGEQGKFSRPNGMGIFTPPFRETQAAETGGSI